MTATKRRQAAIRKAIMSRPIQTQGELVETLFTEGFTVTQATISRDITQLGISKSRNRYVVPPTGESPDRRSTIAAERIHSVERAGPHLLVVKTGAGEAGAAGLELDLVAWKEIVGTIAGDDTVFIACRSENAGSRILKKLKTIITG